MTTSERMTPPAEKVMPNWSLSSANSLVRLSDPGSTLATTGIVIDFVTPCSVRLPTSVWVAPFSPPGLISVVAKEAVGYLSTSKKSLFFRWPVSFGSSEKIEVVSMSTTIDFSSGLPATSSAVPWNALKPPLLGGPRSSSSR